MKEIAMRRSLLMLASFVCLAATASAQDGPKISVGYAYLRSLETGGGSATVGAFLSLAGGGATALELDGGYHRDSRSGSTFETFTLTAGPRFAFSSRRNSAPFMHLLGGLRRDRFQGASNTSWGGMAGLGIDVNTATRVALRLGADFQIFFDHGENVKTLRLGVGLTF
jgi:opacity protein-like surface antigen